MNIEMQVVSVCAKSVVWTLECAGRTRERTVQPNLVGHDKPAACIVNCRFDDSHEIPRSAALI
jgi:hypothetical protein